MDPSGSIDGDGSSGVTPPTVLSRRHQLSAGLIIIVCLCLIAISWSLEQWRHGRLIDIERPFEPRNIEFKIDINQADWPELTLLPDISETMARRIIEHRGRCGGFESLEEIQDVTGIGPRTFAKVKPFLFSIPTVDAAQDQAHTDIGELAAGNAD